eukprot:jgi/Bigna1/91846/estExt_fgenesh1_pg.C_1240008
MMMMEVLQRQQPYHRNIATAPTTATGGAGPTRMKAKTLLLAFLFITMAAVSIVVSNSSSSKAEVAAITPRSTVSRARAAASNVVPWSKPSLWQLPSRSSVVEAKSTPPHVAHLGRAARLAVRSAVDPSKDPFESVDDDSDEWESDGEDLDSPVYVDRDGKKMTEEEYYFKVLGKPMPKSGGGGGGGGGGAGSSDESSSSAEAASSEQPSNPSSSGKKGRKSKKGDRAPLTIPEQAPRPFKGIRNMSRIERILDGSEPQAFKRLTLARFSCKEFEKKAIPDEVLNQVLGLTLRAPTAFNIQPYKVLMVTDDLLKRPFAGAGLERIKPEELQSEIPRYIRFFGEKINSPKEWALKNTMIAVSFYLLAATSLGLATAPMEGFNEDVILKILGIPEGRYTIPLVIPTGYPAGTGKFTKRLPPAEVFYFNSLDEPASNVRAITDSSLVE